MANERTMREPVIAWLRDTGHDRHVFECSVAWGWCDIVGFRFAERTGRKIPPLEQVAAVELKLSKIAEVIHQAETNRNVVPMSWAAMPAAFVARMMPQSIDKFASAGVGLLAVCQVVRVVIQPLGVSQTGRYAGDYDRKRARLPRLLWGRDRAAEAREMARLNGIVDRAVEGFQAEPGRPWAQPKNSP